MLQEKLQRWIMSLPDGPDLQAVNQHVEQLADELYCEYEPTKGPYLDFHSRLDAWLDNIPNEEEQKILFRLMRNLFFIGPKELDNLYRIAFNENICQWIVEHLGIALDQPDLDDQLATAIKRTWFCPITDSMRINAFYHLNHLSGRNLRPDWLSLGRFGDGAKIDAFLKTKGREIDRIVLLEDFVGSGNQISPAVMFAAALPSHTPVLIVPLVVCPKGAAEIESWTKLYGNIAYSPVLKLGSLDFLALAPQAGETQLHTDLRPIVKSTFTQLLGGKTVDEAKIYGPFGFEDTGSLVVLTTNCPDNTLPLIHHSSHTWNPLFPRASRV
jgi:hypothetical protein